MVEPASADAATPPASRRTGLDAADRVHSAELYCENCGRPTAHRLLRVRSRRTGRTTLTEGLARCRECRWTHPFSSMQREPVVVRAVVSQGPGSRSTRFSFDPQRLLQVGDRLDGPDGPVQIRRLESADGRSRPRLRAEEAATLWLVSAGPAAIPISIVEGRITRAATLDSSGIDTIGLGDELRVQGERLVITAVRLGGRTVRQADGPLPADRVERIYARRKANPPAGSIGWRVARDRPRALASSTSWEARSRSSSGRRTKSSSPRA